MGYVFLPALLALLPTSQAAEIGAVRFDLCKHATGERHGPISFDGVETKGYAIVDPSIVAVVVPLQTEDCTMLEFRNGTKATVMGGIREVRCKLRGWPNCKDIEQRELISD